METIYLSLSAQVAEGTIFKKSSVVDYLLVDLFPNWKIIFVCVFSWGFELNTSGRRRHFYIVYFSFMALFMKEKIFNKYGKKGA